MKMVERINIAWALGIVVWMMCPCNIRAQTVLLRDLSKLEDTAIQSFDHDHIVLSNGQLLSWHQIVEAVDSESHAAVPKGRRAAFDRRLRQFGKPLFRVFHRLDIGDIEGAATVASKIFEQEYPRYRSVHHRAIEPQGDQDNDQPTLAQQAAVESLRHDQRFLLASLATTRQLSQGDREKALLAFLVAAEEFPFASNSLVKQINQGWSSASRESHLISQSAVDQFFIKSIHPIWFDTQVAKSTKAAVENYFRFSAEDPKTEQRLKPVGVEVYLISLQLAAISPDDVGSLDTIASRLETLKRRVNDNRMDRSSKPVDSVDNQLANVVGQLRAQVDLMLGKRELAKLKLMELENATSVTLPFSDFLLSYYPQPPAVTEKVNQPSNIAESELADQVIRLIGVAANAAPSESDLAAAAMDRAIEICVAVGDKETANRLKYELMTAYPNTWHAKQRDRRR
ncbi:MAG: hypothetical protein AAFN77_07070 [Planctomycetota bacterium]